MRTLALTILVSISFIHASAADTVSPEDTGTGLVCQYTDSFFGEGKCECRSHGGSELETVGTCTYHSPDCYSSGHCECNLFSDPAMPDEDCKGHLVGDGICDSDDDCDYPVSYPGARACCMLSLGGGAGYCGTCLAVETP